MSLCLAPSAPRNPQIINADKTSLKLQWIEPDILNGIILHYRVSITILVSKQWNYVGAHLVSIEIYVWTLLWPDSETNQIVI